MSKAAKKSVYILMVLLVVALGFAFVIFDKLKTSDENLMATAHELSNVQNELQIREQKYNTEIKGFQDALDEANDEKSDLIEKIQEVQLEVKQQSENFLKEIKTATDDRDKWKRRIEKIKEERGQLMTKIDELNIKLEEKLEPQIAVKTEESQVSDVLPDVSEAPSILPETGRIVDEKYWADLLKEKISLEVDVKNLKEELTRRSIALVEIKHKNEDLKLEINSIESEKEAIITKVRHTADMIDNISLELARTKNDKKYIANRAEKLSEENNDLRKKLKKLVSVKNALEKSIVRISQEKDKVKSQLGRTETLIQSKIDEIWDIKEELDHSIRLSRGGTFPSEVELPPIVVSSSGRVESFNIGESAPGLNGQVISINEPNNFVIVDIGENAGVHLGDNLSVYRDSKYIARLEVIQVRDDISAADLKDQWSKIKVGDVIR